MRNKIIPYNNQLKSKARHLRKNMTLAEQFLWEKIRKKALGVEFHRQVPMLEFIVDFYCHEIGLALEIDGKIHKTQVLEDAYRQGKIEKYGVHFLRFSNDEVLGNSKKVLEDIKQFIRKNS